MQKILLHLFQYDEVRSVKSSREHIIFRHIQADKKSTNYLRSLYDSRGQPLIGGALACNYANPLTTVTLICIRTASQKEDKSVIRSVVLNTVSRSPDSGSPLANQDAISISARRPENYIDNQPLCKMPTKIIKQLTIDHRPSNVDGIKCITEMSNYAR